MAKALTDSERHSRLLAHYRKSKEARDTSVSKLVKLFQETVLKCQTFDSLADELGESYKGLAAAELYNSGVLDGQHPMAADTYIWGMIQDLQKLDGCYPLSSYIGDSGLESQTAITALSEFCNIALQTPPAVRPTFKVVSHSGALVETY